MNNPITTTELQEILRLHVLWTLGAEGGKRADLCAADLRGANLYAANLCAADLRGADLYAANLRGADLRTADLRTANLRTADLYVADLRGADLYVADLRGADLRGANLYAANLLLIGQDIRGYLFYASKNDDDVAVIRAGCREFVGISAARAHWQNRHEDDKVLHADCLSLIDRCETMATVRGWKLEPEMISEAA